MEHNGFEIKNSNSIQFCFTPVHGASQVFLHAAIRCGVIYEDPRENGVSHLLEHLHAKQAMCETNAGAVLRTRASFDAWLEMDAAHFSVAVGATDFMDAVSGLANMVSPLKLNTKDISQEQQVLAEEVEPHRGRDFLSAIYGRLYPKTPYGMPTGGRRKSLQCLTKRQITSADRAFYCRRNMGIAVVGSMDRRKAEETVRLFDQVPIGKELTAPSLDTFRISRNRNIVSSWETPRGESAVVFSIPPTISYVELLCLRILASSFDLPTSPSFKTLRDAEGFHEFDARVHCVGASVTFIVRCVASHVRQFQAVRGMATAISLINAKANEGDLWLSEARTLFAHVSEPTERLRQSIAYRRAYLAIGSSKERYLDVAQEAAVARSLTDEAILNAARKHLNLGSLTIFVDGPRYPGRTWRYCRALRVLGDTNHV